jgi:hypothetical protein
MASTVALVCAMVGYIAVRYGMDRASLIALLFACIYINESFASQLLGKVAASKLKWVAITTGVLLSNSALVHLTNSNLLVAAGVWLPSITIHATLLFRRWLDRS